MCAMTIHPLPRLRNLPSNLPVEGAVRIEIEEGIPILRASSNVEARIEALLLKQQTSRLTAEEEQELENYEEIDDYLSFFNRVARNLLETQAQKDS